MIVAWTGHRPDVFADPAAAQGVVSRLAQSFAEDEGAARVLVGGQRGVDTWAAQAALALGIPFDLILPLEPAQFVDDPWSAADRSVLEQTLQAAASVRIVGGERHAAFTERNRLLASGADVLQAVWTRISGGGTAQTIDFARALGKPVREAVLDPTPSAASAHGRGI